MRTLIDCQVLVYNKYLEKDLGLNQGSTDQWVEACFDLEDVKAVLQSVPDNETDIDPNICTIYCYGESFVTDIPYKKMVNILKEFKGEIDFKK